MRSRLGCEMSRLNYYCVCVRRGLDVFRMRVWAIYRQ